LEFWNLKNYSKTQFFHILHTEFSPIVNFKGILYLFNYWIFIVKFFLSEILDFRNCANLRKFAEICGNCGKIAQQNIFLKHVQNIFFIWKVRGRIWVVNWHIFQKYYRQLGSNDPREWEVKWPELKNKIKYISYRSFHVNDCKKGLFSTRPSSISPKIGIMRFFSQKQRSIFYSTFFDLSENWHSEIF
jgi:hypothetical protein